MFIYILFIIGFVSLVKGADWLVTGSASIAKKHNVSDLVIGLTIVSMGTSMPELIVNILASASDASDIAIGNVIGSNMFNMLMVLGIPIMIHPTEVSSEVLTRDIPIMITLSLLMGWMVFIYGRGKFDRVEGGFLFSCFIAYQYWLFTTISA